MSGCVSGQCPLGGHNSQEPSPEGECVHDGGVRGAAHSSLPGWQAGLFQVAGQDHCVGCHAGQLRSLRTLQDTQTGQGRFLFVLLLLLCWY